MKNLKKYIMNNTGKKNYLPSYFHVPYTKKTLF